MERLQWRRGEIKTERGRKRHTEGIRGLEGQIMKIYAREE